VWAEGSTIVNELPQGRPGREVVAAAVRQTLSGLDGPWVARIASMETGCIEIAAPDGFPWLAFVPNPGCRRATPWTLAASRLRSRPGGGGRGFWSGRSPENPLGPRGQG